MAKDRYRYFRIEAQELIEGLGQGLLELEHHANADVVRRLLRQAHTLKGAARVVKKGEIGDLSHRFEDCLSPYRETGGPVPRDSVSQALALVDLIRHEVSGLDAPPPSPGSALPSQPSPPTTEPSVDDAPALRIALRDLDELHDLALETHTEVSSLLRTIAQFSELQDQVVHVLDRPTAERVSDDARRLVDPTQRGLREIAERAERVLAGVQALRASTSDLRMVPAETLMADVQRAAREAAHALGMEVDVRWTGSRLHVDAHILAGLRGALNHIVRNSVAHGFERGSVGHIEIAIEQQGQRICIRCRDDGRGLNLAAIRDVVVARGLTTPDEVTAMGEREIIDLLMSGGISTSRSVTDVSGRGVGLDAVRHAIGRLNGRVTLENIPEQGVTVEIVVPISLASVAALSLQVGATSVLLPIDHVRKTLRLRPSDIIHSPDGDQLVLDGTLIPFLPLSTRLGEKSTSGRPQSAVVLSSGEVTIALGTDHVGEVKNVVVRAVPRLAALDPIIDGATIDEGGAPRLVLSSRQLLQASREMWSTKKESPVARLPPILVIDDSLTTRMLEQSILESAGYEVDVAVCGEEALQKARRRHYGVFVVDVEMPGMSGFEFIEQTRLDPDLRRTPAILVTSRSDAADKLRGKDAGARAYIVKSEFDQAELLQMIRRFVG